MMQHVKHEGEKVHEAQSRYSAKAPEPAAKSEPEKLFVVWQALKTSNTASIYGTYQDRKTAERVVSEVRGSGAHGQAHREARYFVQELVVEEIAKQEEAKAEEPK